MIGAAIRLALSFGAALIAHFLAGTNLRLVLGLIAGAALLLSVANAADGLPHIILLSKCSLRTSASACRSITIAWFIFPAMRLSIVSARW
jgi:hypothetical protein